MRAGALSPHASVSSLPYSDAAGTLSDPSLPLLFYRVPEASNDLLVAKDVAGDTIVLSFLDGR